MIAYKMNEKNFMSSIYVNVMSHSKNGEILTISLKIRIFQFQNIICILSRFKNAPLIKI